MCFFCPPALARSGGGFFILGKIMTDPNNADPSPEVLKIWQTAEAAYGTNAERPLQIVIGNTASAGERFFLLSVLPGQSAPALVLMESRIPLRIRRMDSSFNIEDHRDQFGRVTIIRGDIQEAEFGEFGVFLNALGVDLA